MKYKNKSQLSILLSIFFSTIFSAINASAASPIINISSTSVGIAPGSSERVNIDATDFYGTITVSSSNTAVASVKMLGCESAEVCTVRNRNVVLAIQGLSTGSASATVSFSGAISSSDIRLNETQKIDIKVENTDAHLSKLSISPLTINFDSNTTVYTVVAEHDLKSIEVSATAANPTATISGTGTYILKDYLNTIEVSVATGDGSQMSYKVNVKRKDINGRTAASAKENGNRTPSSNDNTLKDIVIPGYEIEFNNEETEYAITVKPKTENLMIRAVPNNENATIEIEGHEDIKIGENIIKIVVTAENGDKKEFTIKVTRPSNEDATLITRNSEDDNPGVLGVSANGNNFNIFPIILSIASVFTITGIITTIVFLRKKSDNRCKQFNVMRVNNGFRPNSIG